MSAQLRGILFDLDDTLADSTGTDAKVWERIADALVERFPGTDREELGRRYAEALESHFPELLAGTIDFRTFRRRRLATALEPWGAVDDELFEWYYAEKARVADEATPFAEAIATLRGLRARGIRVGCLTNGPSEFQRRKLEVSGLGPELDAIAVSEELGVEKPAREAFVKALGLLGTKAEETAMVGDNLEADVLGAIAAGFAAVVWMPGAQQGDLPPGAHLAREIAEVPRLLGLDGDSA